MTYVSYEINWIDRLADRSEDGVILMLRNERQEVASVDLSAKIWNSNRRNLPLSLGDLAVKQERWIQAKRNQRDRRAPYANNEWVFYMIGYQMV